MALKNHPHPPLGKPGGYELELIRNVGADTADRLVLQRRESSEEIITSSWDAGTVG